ncbi:MAG: flagellar brake protein [Lachnospiraceae bacterium]|nr:flagellar brake protein [Lachnospiraceae bacterium]
MISKYVAPGDKIDIMAVKGEQLENKVEERVYKTVVYDVVSDDEIKITMPMEKGKLILLPVEGEYDLTFYSTGNLYQCYAKVIERYKANSVFVLSMQITSNLRKYQRREYYCLNCILDMKCMSIDDSNQDNPCEKVEFVEADFMMQDGIIVDISGGGARFISTVQFEKDTYILFKFNLKISEENVPYQIKGKIINSEEIEQRPGEFENRVQFSNLNNDDREGIIKFIFEEERKIRRREKG